MSASQLYQEVILDHNRKPRNYGKLDGADREAEGLNPLCGDHIWVYLRTAGEQIDAIGFEGQSCAICKASASMMTAAVKGKSVAQAEELAREFRDMTTGRLDIAGGAHHLGRLTVFAGVRDLPNAREVRGIAVAYSALGAALRYKNIDRRRGRSGA